MISKIETVKVELLNYAIYNPRMLTEEQEKNLTESIKRFGMLDPIIVNKHKDRENIVVGGNQRLKIAIKLGYTEIPVVYVDLVKENEVELNLRLNKNTGQWDYDLLKQFDTGLLLDVGFDDLDLSSIWDNEIEIEDDLDFNEKEELEKITSTNIKDGDLFKMGNSYLICGDSLKMETLTSLLQGKKIDMVYWDPPFNIGLNYNKGIGGNANYGGNVNDRKSDADYKDFIMTILRNSLSFTKDDTHVFSYCDQKYIGMFQEIYKEAGISNKRVCLWIKNGMNLTPNIAFNKCFEPCIYGTKGKPFLSNTKNLNEILNKEVETGNRTIDDIIDLLDIWLCKRDAGSDYGHPTQKPLTLHEKPLKRCTKPGDIILDMCGGSGSTLLACEQLKRTAYLVEISPVFCQLIINRYKKYYGKEAIKIN